MKYCLQCGTIHAESFEEYENEDCETCGFLLTEDPDMTEDQFLKLSEAEKDAYELKIYNICKQSEFFNEVYYNEARENMASWYMTYRFDRYEQLTGKKAFTKENELYHRMAAKKRVAETMARYAGTTNSNAPKCPTCNSTNIEKISLGKKAFGGAMFGIFSSNVRNTFHCKNCGYKW